MSKNFHAEPQDRQPDIWSVAPRHLISRSAEQTRTIVYACVHTRARTHPLTQKGGGGCEAALVSLCDGGLNNGHTQVSLHMCEQQTRVCVCVCVLGRRGSAMVAFVLRGLWGRCVNTQTSTQTHPAARSHHVVEERGQSVRPLKRLTQPGQRAPDLTAVFHDFFFFFSSKLRWQMSSFTRPSSHSWCLRKVATAGCKFTQKRLSFSWLKFVIQKRVTLKKKTFSNVVDVQEIPGKWESRKTTTGSLNNRDFQNTIC